MEATHRRVGGGDDQDAPRAPVHGQGDRREGEGDGAYQSAVLRIDHAEEAPTRGPGSIPWCRDIGAILISGSRHSPLALRLDLQNRDESLRG